MPDTEPDACGIFGGNRVGRNILGEAQIVVATAAADTASLIDIGIIVLEDEIARRKETMLFRCGKVNVLRVFD